jgi:hypothetical protein
LLTDAAAFPANSADRAFAEERFDDARGMDFARLAAGGAGAGTAAADEAWEETAVTRAGLAGCVSCVAAIWVAAG